MFQRPIQVAHPSTREQPEAHRRERRTKLRGPHIHGLATGERVGLVAVGEWELIGRKQMVVVLPVVSSRRSEPMIEETKTSTSDVRNHSVEDLPSRFIGIESVVQKLPQTTS